MRKSWWVFSVLLIILSMVSLAQAQPASLNGLALLSLILSIPNGPTNITRPPGLR